MRSEPSCTARQAKDLTVNMPATRQAHRTARGAVGREDQAAVGARGRLCTYVRKPQALYAFFKEFKADGPVTRNLYGAAQCSSTIRGTKPAPRSLCRRRAAMAFGGEESVDERLTTQCCWKCGARCQPVAYPATGLGEAWRPRRVVRGLVFCDSRTCGRLTNRDFQGALNMACGVGPRPEHMARTAVGVKRTDVRLLLRT